MRTKLRRPASRGNPSVFQRSPFYTIHNNHWQREFPVLQPQPKLFLNRVEDRRAGRFGGRGVGAYTRRGSPIEREVVSALEAGLIHHGEGKVARCEFLQKVA